MSEFHIEVVKLNEIKKHDNADSLSVAMVHGGYPCIIKTTDFKEGDLAVYIPVDSMCPISNPIFSFLDTGKNRTHERIKAKKLRGIFSMGLLIPCPEIFKEGDNLQEYFGILKYIPPAEQEPEERIKRPHKKGNFLSYLMFVFFGKWWIALKRFLGLMPPPPPKLPYYDIEGLRKYLNLFQEGEEVVLTEKIDGTSSVYVFTNENFFFRSRTVFRKLGDNSTWDKIAQQYSLKDKLKNYPDYAVFGEIYGSPQAHRGFNYGVPVNTEDRFIVFDVLNINTKKYLDYDDLVAFCKEADLPTVPELYRGPWSKELIKFAEGPSTMPDTKHIREGFVAKPVKERFDNHFGRVILKLPGEGYLLAIGKIK